MMYCPGWTLERKIDACGDRHETNSTTLLALGPSRRGPLSFPAEQSPTAYLCALLIRQLTHERISSCYVTAADTNTVAGIVNA
jgi:hypothetical protein